MPPSGGQWMNCMELQAGTQGQERRPGLLRALLRSLAKARGPRRPECGPGLDQDLPAQVEALGKRVSPPALQLLQDSAFTELRVSQGPDTQGSRPLSQTSGQPRSGLLPAPSGLLSQPHGPGRWASCWAEPTFHPGERGRCWGGATEMSVTEGVTGATARGANCLSTLLSPHTHTKVGTGRPLPSPLGSMGQAWHPDPSPHRAATHTPEDCECLAHAAHGWQLL